MPSSRRLHLALLALAALLGAAATSPVAAQSPAQGFAVERLYLSAPGAGFLVMDSLDMRGGLGGAVALTGSYARMPLRLPASGGAPPLGLVSDQAFADVAVAATYDRFRLSLGFASPLVSRGRSGTVAGRRFTAPPLNLGQDPDGLSDTRVGFQARVLGDSTSALRLGLGGWLLIPAGDRVDYVTDATYRGVAQLLVAGDVGRFCYAAQLGVHLRPLDDAPIVGSPRGSELLAGVAAGMRWPLGRDQALVAGPELFGQSAFAALLGNHSTGLEALLSARFEGAADVVTSLHVKLGVGAGLHPDFGVPEWRAVVSFELQSRPRATPPAAAASPASPAAKP